MMNRRHELRGTTLGELHAYDGGEEYIEGTDAFDDLIYNMGRDLDDGYIGNEPMTLIWVSGSSRRVWATTDPNPTGRTIMELVIDAGGFGY